MAAGAPPIQRHWLYALSDILELERPQWFHWVPVGLGLGIALYFWLPMEPTLGLAALAAFSALALRILWRRGLVAALVTGLALTASLGFLSAKVRTELVRAPVLERRIGPVDVAGRVELVEPSPGRGERITLAVASISGLTADSTPARVRIRSLMAAPGLKPGDRIRVRAVLQPPSGPGLPGDYDFARWAWYGRLGGVGYALKAPEIAPAAPPDGDEAVAWQTRIERLRQVLGQRVVAALPGQTGSIATALITGERGGIDKATTDAFRNSGLLHILSISGLHMVVMAGAAFATMRLALAAVPALVLAYPIKKWAAGAAMAAAFAYLAISGGSVATVRSAIMIAIMLTAIMLERPAIAMRNVALTAIIVLGLWPESLLDVGFQMSFAAVVSLVAVYEFLRARADPEQAGEDGVLGRSARFVGGIVISTLVAGLSVAPLAAYHFHKSQQYAVLANLLAIPICNFVVMPSGLVTLVLMPLGLEAWPLAVMGKGIDAMTWSAQAVASLPGAVANIPAIPKVALCLMIVGGLWLALWRTRWRALGAAAIAAGLVAAPFGKRPDVLVGHGGGLVAVRLADGRLALLTERGTLFEARRWLDHDGDERAAETAAAAPGGFTCDGVGCQAMAGTRSVAVARHPAALADDCARADLVILTFARPPGCTRPALVLDAPALGRAGTHALYARSATGWDVETVAAERGVRPWSERWDARATAGNAGPRPDGKAPKQARAGEAAAVQGGEGAPANFPGEPLPMSPEEAVEDDARP